MNTELNINTSAPIDPSTPFSASRYFEALRSLGLRPCVSGNGDTAEAISMLLHNQCEASEEALVWHKWAMAGDPQQTAQGEYAKTVWAQRQDDVKVVALGF